MMREDARATKLLDWLVQDLSLAIRQFQPASSDASFRRYFRIQTEQGSFIAMDAPPERENIDAFIAVRSLLAQAGVNVPIIYRQAPEHGFLLLEDFGSTCFLDRLQDTAQAEPLYQAALDSLLKQQIRVVLSDSGLPRYDRALLQRELELFEQWFLDRSLGLSIPASLRYSLHQLLIASALEQPITCVHRDYHSRNLMVVAKDNPGVIDFQDAVAGPITYDLVSLLKDCYIRWPEARIERWMMRYYHTLLANGLVQCEPAQFRRWFDFMGMQRHLKAIGIFSRLHLRDQKSDYLKDIPRTLEYVIQTCQRYPEFSEFSGFLHYQVLPAYSHQS